AGALGPAARLLWVAGASRGPQHPNGPPAGAPGPDGGPPDQALPAVPGPDRAAATVLPEGP
ncbi:ABC transporter ATP-binding protein, partial [Frankia sp. AiPs1]|nr:ABC transporter ATP-binding protein [Frankia sp. AiPs1]